MKRNYLKNNKKIFLLAGLITLVLTIILLSIFIPKNKVKLSFYDKYSINMIVTVTSKDGKFETYESVINNDGKNMMLESKNVDSKGYITDNKLQYIKDQKIYECKIDKSYKDIESQITNIRSIDYESEDYYSTTYTSLLNEKDTNEFLESIFLGKTTNLKNKITIITKDNKVSNIKLTLSDIDKYKEVDIELMYKELDDEYIVDTSRVDQNSFNAMVESNYERIETDKNIYEVMAEN